MAQNLTLENQNDAQEQEVNGTGLLPLFHSAIVEQRGATEELRAVSRELQTILNDILTAKPELRVAYQELLVEPDSEASHRQTTTATPAMNLAQLKREAKRNLRKSRELIRESARVRLHSKTLRAALRGARRFKPDSGTNGSNHDGLSRREYQVLHLMVKGQSSKEIAHELGISFKTAVTHRASIMNKMEVHEVASVVREAIRRGMV